MTLPEISLAAFAVLNVGRGLAYAPQLVRIYRDNNGASAVSVTTWFLFSAANLATVAHALVCANDMIAGAVFAFNAVGCGSIAALTAWRRLGRRRAAIAQ